MKKTLLWFIIVIAIGAGWYFLGSDREEVTSTEQRLRGEIVYGAEVRTFTPCGGTPMWILGNSPAYQEILTNMKKALGDSEPYRPIFGELLGEIRPAPTDGFGADYESGFFATRLLQLVPDGGCQ